MLLADTSHFEALPTQEPAVLVMAAKFHPPNQTMPCMAQSECVSRSQAPRPSMSL